MLTLQLSDPQTIAEVAAAAAATANPACCSASDPTSAAAAAAAQGCFQVVLPPPELGHQGYVLLQSQYVALVQRTWEVGSRVQVRHVVLFGGGGGTGLHAGHTYVR